MCKFHELIFTGKYAERRTGKDNLVILLQYGIQFMCLDLELNIHYAENIGLVWEKKMCAEKGKEFKNAFLRNCGICSLLVFNYSA